MKKISLIVGIMTLLAGCSAPAPKQELLKENARSQLIHSYCYQYRYGSYSAEKNDDLAKLWCEQGAELGIASSQVLLAELYLAGLSVDKDLDKAKYWYQQAAKQQHPHAQKMLVHLGEKTISE